MGAKAIHFYGLAALAIAVFQQTAITTYAAEPAKGRVFYDVLGDVLGDFEHDVKTEAVKGLANIAVREVVVNENVPASFRDHLDLLITERVVRNTKTKILQCLACKARRTSMTQDKVVITSPRTNSTELKKIAKEAGIQHFLEANFSYQTSELTLALTITEAATGVVIWTRSYNSETSRAAMLRRGYDPATGGELRKVTEYSPSLQYRGSVGYLFEPDSGGLTGCLAFGFRMVERYDNRRKEIGFEVNYLKDSSSLIGGAAADPAKLYTGINVTMLFVHGWNFIGDEEDYNKARAGAIAGIGGTFASGYLGAVFRTGLEWRLGKHSSVTTTLGYRPTSTALLSSTTSTITGLEFGGGVSLMF